MGYLGNARVVDHHVKAAEGGFGVCHRRVHLLPTGDVGNESGRLSADSTDLVGDILHFRLVEIHNGDVRAVGGQSERDAAPDPLPGTGNQDNLVLNTHE